VLLRFLKLLFELSHLFGQMAYPIGIPTAWFLPGLLRGIEGLNQPVLLAAVLVEPTTLRDVVSRERSVALHHLQNLSVRPFLGAPLSETPSRACFLGTCLAALEAVVALAILARAFSFVHSTQVGVVTR
jgi:hypothetical protein